MRKILVVHTLGFAYEGMSSVIYNYCSNMNMQGLKFDFLSPKVLPPTLKEKFCLIGRVLEVPNRKKELPEYCKALIHLCTENRYDVVHIHGNSGTMIIESLLAKMSHVSKVIIHNHSTSCDHPFLNKLLSPIMIHTADCLLSCSELAGKWLYGKANFRVLKNAIDVEQFKFDAANRLETRKELRIGQEFVLGHIGHFSEPKNHDFLIDLFARVFKTKPNMRLLLVSDGPRMDIIKDKVIKLGLERYVIFAGRRTDPESMYSAMDMFLMPSKWEGFPLSLIEAQASGLRCVVSDNVTGSTNVTDSVKFVSLDDMHKWEQCILQFRELDNQERESVSENNVKEISKKGYDIRTESNKLREIYLR